VIVILIYASLHFTNRKRQGADLRSRSDLLYTIKNMLDSLEGFDRFEQDLELISLYFIPDVKDNHIVGLFILLIWLLSVAASAVAGWIFNMWFLVPCMALMPLSNFIMYRFFQYWRDNDCKISLFYEIYSSIPDNNVPLDGGSEPDVENFAIKDTAELSVPSTNLSGNYRIKFSGDWEGSMLSVKKISSCGLVKGLTVCGKSSATFIARWDGNVLTVKSVLFGSLGVGHLIRGKNIPDNITVINVIDEIKGTFTLSSHLPATDSQYVSLASVGSSLQVGTSVESLDTGKGGKGTYKLSIEQSIPEKNVEMYALVESNFIGEIDGNTLTVSKINSGFLTVGQVISSEGVADGTTITEILSGEGCEGTYTVKAPNPAASIIISFKCLSPLKRYMIRNWVLSLTLDVVAMLLSIPSRHNEVPFLIFLFKTHVFLSYGALIRYFLIFYYTQRNIFTIHFICKMESQHDDRFPPDILGRDWLGSSHNMGWVW
jgi:hypothetical protein